MPITTLASYPITMEEFIVHWTQVNAFLGVPANALVLQGGYNVAALTGDRTSLLNAMTNVVNSDNFLSNMNNDRDLKKAALRPRLTQFRGLVQGALMGSIYVRTLPTMPHVKDSEGVYLRPFEDMLSLWTQINTNPPQGFTGPLLLAGGYAVATFTTDLAALKTAYTTANDATQTATLNRETRDALLPAIRARLQQYRKAVLGKLPPGNPLLATIPAYSPPPGSTPDPVNVSVAWNPAMSKAVLTWTPSTDPHLSSYSIRTAPGPVYKAKDETSIGDVPAGTLTFDTASGLAAPGSSAQFRVYVVLTTGNEKGSATVKVTRPETSM